MNCKHTKCNICGGNTKEKFQLNFRDVIGMVSSYTQCISLCPNCGFIFTSNPFSDAQLNNRYKLNSKYEFDEKDYASGEDKNYKERSLRQKHFIMSELDKDEVKSVLEVGAASGFNLSLYDGIETLGIEPSYINCVSGKKRYGVDMFCGVFDEFYAQRSDSKQYDLIFLSHVLEHIVNPYDFIKKCAEMNSKYFFIEVPTLDYKFIDQPYAMFCDEHVNIFTLESLENLMIRCGYSLIKADFALGIGENSVPAGCPALVSLFKKCDNGKRHYMVQSVETCFDNYVRTSEVEMKRISAIIDAISNDVKLAIWGIGNHASMLLGNTNLNKKNIVKAYDSDLKKRGELFAGANIQPFEKSDIERGMVEAVLVATYTGQKAIEKILSDYNDKIQLIKLYDL